MTNRRKGVLRPLLLGGALASGLAGATLSDPISDAMGPDAIRALTRDAYLYAYPIVTMDATMRQATNVPDATSVSMRAPVNQFAHARAYPDADARDVVRFNFDTLYSFAWLDVSDEPMVVSVPDTDGRYYLLPMLDMWTDVFAVVGSRTTGTEAGHYAVVAPGWDGALPAGVERIVAPTPVVWILGRTKTDGPADYANVHAVQDGYRITPLSAWGGDYTAPAAVATDPQVDDTTPPLVQVDELSGVEMLTRLSELLGRMPPHANDYPTLFRLRAFGIEPGKRFDPDTLDPETAELINTAAATLLAEMQTIWERTGVKVNGWTLQNDNIGTYGTSYLKRALVAKGGLGANLPEDAVYPTTNVDSEGRQLSGEFRYKLHFPADALPPADAFWSLTMYDMDGFQVPNPIDRFALSSHSDLAFNPDGSLDIFVQVDSPGPENEANWLPAPDGPFQPTMRLYSPRAEVLDGRWAPPPFERIGSR